MREALLPDARPDVDLGDHPARRSTAIIPAEAAVVRGRPVAPHKGHGRAESDRWENAVPGSLPLWRLTPTTM